MGSGSPSGWCGSAVHTTRRLHECSVMHRVTVLGPCAGVLACDVHGPEQELLLVRRVPLCAAALVFLTNPTAQ